MSGLIYSATVELVPSTLPVGASDSSPFMQAITITLQNNGAGSWANNEIHEMDNFFDSGIFLSYCITLIAPRDGPSS